MSNHHWKGKINSLVMVFYIFFIRNGKKLCVIGNHGYGIDELYH